VRIELDPKELAEHPLQVGLSMDVEVDTHDTGGARLPQVAKQAAPYKTDVFGSLESRADARVREIIAANDGSGGPAARGASVARSK
jgi:membrane fusion protein (multidrug efflux system)